VANEGLYSGRLGDGENGMIGCPAQAYCKNHPFQHPRKLLLNAESYDR
jgi:hypothetical protein